MADCKGCNDGPCSCGNRAGRDKPRAALAAPPLGLVAGVMGFTVRRRTGALGATVRRRRADIIDLAAQLSYAGMGAALLAVLTLAARR